MVNILRFKYKSILLLFLQRLMVHIAVCNDIMKWKQSSMLCSKFFLSSISILNSLSRASCTYMHVLMSISPFSLFQFVLKVIGTPSHLLGSTCLSLSPTVFITLLHKMWGYNYFKRYD